MFSANIGDRYLPTESSDGALHCSATLDTTTDTTYLKVVNTTDEAQTVTLRFLGSAATQATTTVLTGDPAELNSVADPHRVTPQPGHLSGADGTFEYAVPAHSATVIVCDPPTSNRAAIYL